MIGAVEFIQQLKVPAGRAVAMLREVRDAAQAAGDAEVVGRCDRALSAYMRQHQTEQSWTRTAAPSSPSTPPRTPAEPTHRLPTPRRTARGAPRLDRRRHTSKPRARRLPSILTDQNPNFGASIRFKRTAGAARGA
jgi:hypothetical protein